MTATVATFLFAAAWKGTLLVAFALAVHRVARNRVPSRWLCALLLVAIVRLLVPVAPAASFSVFNLMPGDTGRPAPILAGEANVGRGFSPPLHGGGRAEAPPYVPQPWVPMVLALWGAGALFVIARAALQTRRFRRQLADAEDVVRDDVLALVEEARGTLRVRRRVRVVTTSAVATPSLHGWLHPTLLLPAGLLSTFTLEQVRYVVLHELAHLRRSDVLVNWITTAAHALHWFNPLVRLAIARFAEERELACDALALAALRAEERPAYGGTVLELVDRMRLASAVSTSPRVPALVGMTATPEQLKRRILMIASFRQHRFSIVFPALVAAVGLATLTDARAGEPAKREMHMRQEATPPIKATMQKLETPVNAELTGVSIDAVLHTIMNTTGASVTLAEGALDDATRAQRLNVKAKNVPAHLVLFESLGVLHLAVKFTDTGVVVMRLPEEGEGQIHMRKAEHEASRVRIRKADGDAAKGDRIIRVTEDGERGSGKRRLTIQGPGEAGELEVELVKP